MDRHVLHAKIGFQKSIFDEVGNIVSFPDAVIAINEDMENQEYS